VHLPPNKIWIIEHATGIFLGWRNFFFFKRAKFSWLYRDGEGYCFKNFVEAQENLIKIKQTHRRAYLVELKARRPVRSR
jgi:CRISPR/Cas system CMR-associated protein Cmr1 (group 7 of RAMP superfamily)